MYSNIGGKIKDLAVFVFCLGAVITVLVGCFWMFKLKQLIGLVWILGGPFFSWLGSFTLYGFGQLVENSDTMVRMSKELLDNGNNKLNSSETLHRRKELPNPYEDDTIDESMCEQITLLNKALDQGRITEEKYIKILNKIINKGR